ncbi:MAG: hypothetical protein IJT97_01175 [Bacteroidaceae bacterium]|nr:hypothetical protein [Bacteroidaceae bacterium]
MARPIKDTPTLFGEDARRFARAIEHPRTISSEDVRRAEDAYNQMRTADGVGGGDGAGIFTPPYSL